MRCINGVNKIDGVVVVDEDWKGFISVTHSVLGVVSLIGGMVLSAFGVAFAIYKGAVKVALSGSKIESRIGELESKFSEYMKNNDAKFLEYTRYNDERISEIHIEARATRDSLTRLVNKLIDDKKEIK